MARCMTDIEVIIQIAEKLRQESRRALQWEEYETVEAFHMMLEYT